MTNSKSSNMKIKHVLASVGLTMMCGIGTLAGLNHVKEAKVTKADAGDTWMFAAYLDISDMPEWKSQCSNFRFHVWGTNVDETLPMHESGAEDLLTVNCSFSDTQSVSGGQFIFYQAGDQNSDKTSTDASFTYNKDSDFFGHMSWNFKADTTWPDGKWELTAQSWSRAMYYYYDTTGTQQSANFDIDPVNNEFFIKDFVVNENNIDKTFDILVRNQWYDGFDIIYKNENIKTGSDGWFKFNSTGTYDIFVHNECISSGDKGIIEVKKQGTTSSYIYYVTQSSNESVDYVYTYGYDQAYGTWPATRISKEASIDTYFFDSIDFKYYGSDTEGVAYNRVVYRIPVTIGYPADNKVIFHNNNGAQTSEMDIVAHRAYFWKNGSSFSNDNDGAALDLLIDAEELRQTASNSSVCNISQSAAEDIYTRYLALNVPSKTLVDRSLIYTYDSTIEAGTFDDVSYADIMHRLGIIAGIIAEPSNSFTSISDNNSIIVALAIISFAGVTIGLFLVRRRKTN